MIRPLAPLLALTLAGCTFFDDARETFEGLTNPLVGLGLLLDVRAPDSDAVDLEGSEYEAGTGLTMFLADAAEADDIEQSPVTGAEVTMQDVVAEPSGDGLYTILPGEGLTWDAGQATSVSVALGDDTATANVQMPHAPDWVAPSQWTAGDDMTVDLGGQPYDSVLVVVLDGSDGSVTWSNEPRTAREIYDFTHRSTDLVVTIPGDEAFPDETVYVVGVSGTVHTGASDLDGMNTAMSTVMSGVMVTDPVNTMPMQ